MRVDDSTVQGEALFTTLHVHNQSVVKYRVGDIMRFTVAPCRCQDPLPRLYFVERTHDALVIAGEKFRHCAILEALQEVLPELRFLALHISDLPEEKGHARLRILLPEEARPSKADLFDVLKEEVFELDSIYRYGLVRFELEFHPPGYFEGRKIRKVVDTRQHMGT
jgi:phenylacetate-coenzyme A ligase PaaK-like adenylate-forming protein